MLTVATQYFERESIDSFGVLPISACRVVRPELFERGGSFCPRSTLVFLVPYYTGPSENLSLYAVSRDYHVYMRSLTAGLIDRLRTAHPGATFRSFSDHSPIDERHAAATAGLGILGDNGLLIHKKYGSLVFIGEVFSDLDAPADAATTISGPCAGSDRIK